MHKSMAFRLVGFSELSSFFHGFEALVVHGQQDHHHGCGGGEPLHRTSTVEGDMIPVGANLLSVSSSKQSPPLHSITIYSLIIPVITVTVFV